MASRPRTKSLMAAATVCAVAAALAAGAIAGAGARKSGHCRVCQIGGSLTLSVESAPSAEDPFVYVYASGQASSKQRLCRRAGATELWRRLSNGKPDRDIGDPEPAPANRYRSTASFNIWDGIEKQGPIDYAPGSTVEFWAVRPKYKTTSGIIGSPIYKCRRLESRHVFVPVPDPPATGG